MSNLADFLLARIAEEEAAAQYPHTVMVSGGAPGLEVPNCVGPDGRGCPERWRMLPEREPGWWRREDVKAAMRAHELTHATPEHRFVLAECGARRAIVELHAPSVPECVEVSECTVCAKPDTVLPDTWLFEWWPCRTLRLLAQPYADHPDYDREEWSM